VLPLTQTPNRKLFGGLRVVQTKSHGFVSNKEIPVKCRSAMSAIHFKQKLTYEAEKLNLAKNKTEPRQLKLGF
jgi:hypothetical protein